MHNDLMKSSMCAFGPIPRIGPAEPYPQTREEQRSRKASMRTYGLCESDPSDDHRVVVPYDTTYGTFLLTLCLSYSITP